MTYLSEKYEWALTREAAELFGDLVKKGLDRDLAMQMVELELGEEKTYLLDDDGPQDS